MALKGRITVIFLFVCLVAPVTVTYTWLHHQKRQVRREVKHQIMAGLDKSDLVLLKFTPETKTQLKWKHSKEFSYREQMYDIVITEVRGDTTFYWCWWDNKETALNQQLDSLLAGVWGNHPKNRDGQQRVAHFMHTLFFPEYKRNDLVVFFANECLVWQYEFGFSNYSTSPPTPPPRLV